MKIEDPKGGIEKGTNELDWGCKNLGGFLG